MCFKTNNLKIEKIINHLEIIYNETKVGLEDFLNDYSKNVDKVIIDTQVKDGVVYQTGTLSLSLVNDDIMQINIELYFQTSSAYYIKKELSCNNILISDYLNAASIAKLREVKVIKFDIETPKGN